MSQFIYETLNKHKVFYNFKDIPLHIFKILLNEIGNEKFFFFDRKINSLLAEISVLNELKNKYKFNLKNRENKNGACDWIIEKNGKTFQVEIKQKESGDLFMMRIEFFFKGFALLSKNNFLRRKFWCFKMLTKYNDEGIKKVWESLIKFIESKNEYFIDENIVIFNLNIRKNKKIMKQLIKHNPKIYYISNFNIADIIITEIKNEDILRIIENPLNKLKRKKEKYDNFLSALVYHRSFYNEIEEKSFVDNVIKKIEDENLKPFLLMIYDIFGNKKSYFFS
jgi:hypothetical protein